MLKCLAVQAKADGEKPTEALSREPSVPPALPPPPPVLALPSPPLECRDPDYEAKQKALEEHTMRERARLYELYSRSRERGDGVTKGLEDLLNP